ncbi:MAG: protoporphyrinogen oxidase [Akkermansiaceae bacterium]
MDAKYPESSAETAIIGAGITGLCVAHTLHQQSAKKHSFDIIDSSMRVGGAIQSTLDDGYLAEHGPNSILLKDRRVSSLLEQIGLADPGEDCELIQARPEAKKRYIVQCGRLVAMPGSPLSLINSPLLSYKGKLRLLAEPFIGRFKPEENNPSEESFAHFVRRRLGPEVLESAAGPFVNGIYAGDPETLSVRHAFPRLWAMEQQRGSVILAALAHQFGRDRNPHRLKPSRIVSFQSGMHALPKAIAETLPNDSMHLGSSISSIKQQGDSWHITWSDSEGKEHQKQYARLIITVPPHCLSSLPLPASLSQCLQPVYEIESPPVTSLVLGFKREDVAHPLDGFGMLIKQAEKSPLLGVIFSSSMFNGRAPDGHVTLTCMMGGSLNPGYADNDDQLVLDELRRLLGVTGQPTFRHQTSWPRAIPQYSLDYQQKLAAMEHCENSHPGLYLAGNYRNGISVVDCILNGLQLGEQLASH